MMARNDAETRRRLIELEAMDERAVCGELVRLTPFGETGRGICVDCQNRIIG